MKLTGSQVRQVQDALADAFDPDSLRMLVRTRLDADLDDIAPPGTMRVTAFRLIEWAEKHGRTQELIAAACDELPGNPALQALRPLAQAAPPPAAPAPEVVYPTAFPDPIAPPPVVAAAPASARERTPGAPSALPTLAGRYEAVVRGVAGALASFVAFYAILALIGVPTFTGSITLVTLLPLLVSAALGWLVYARRPWVYVFVTAGLALLLILTGAMSF